MMKNLWTLLICLLSVSAYGQASLSSSNKKAQKSFEQASQLLSLKQYEKAAEQLEAAVKEDTDFAGAFQQLGDIYRKLQQYPKAKANYRRVLEIDPEYHSLTYFGLAESEFYTENYAASLSLFKKYLTYPKVPESTQKLAAKYITDCEFSIDAIKKPVPFSPKNLGPEVNSAASEYLPVITADEGQLIFTRRAGNKEDFYQSKKVNAVWEKSAYLSKNINTAEFNEGAQCISPDGMYLFFTGCNRPDGLGRCDIYVCRREGKDWSKPFNLGAPVNGSGWESQPSVSADGKTLYFISSRAGGLGGFDIWKTSLQEGGSWTVPVNLGPDINTPYDEESAFIHPDGKTLYFSSKGWPGLGGRDVFFSKTDASGKWQKPVNLGYPINTSKDEGGLTVSTNGKTAYFSSDQKGGLGEMDLYSFELPQALKPNLVTYVKGRVYDADTKQPLDAQVKIARLKDNQLTYDDITDAENGGFLITLPAGDTYSLTAERPGYLFFSENISLQEIASASKPYQLEVPLHKIALGGMTVLNNIFFETGKFELLPESKTELQQLISFLNQNPKVSIEIGGHTDDIGNDKANLLLSENRAREVHKFLLTNRIPAFRLSYKGFGESLPAAENTSDEGRRKNRRTEFKITRL